jgi:hypothetical protein
MPIYTGSIIRRFVLDRLAMGLPEKSIKDEFISTYGEATWRDDIVSALNITQEEVVEREGQLAAEYTSTSFTDKLYGMMITIEDMMSIAKSKGDVRSYAVIAPQYMKTLEIIERLIEKNRQKLDSNLKELDDVRNNLLMLKLLAKDGIITINDEEKLKVLMGA